MCLINIVSNLSLITRDIIFISSVLMDMDY